MKGYTLLEILIVLAIAAIGFMILYPHCGVKSTAQVMSKTEPFGPGIEHRVVCFLGIRYLVIKDKIQDGIAITPLYRSAMSIQTCEIEKP